MKRAFAIYLLLFLNSFAFAACPSGSYYTTNGDNCIFSGASTPFPISGTTNIPTYAAANASIANVGAGDIFCIAGSNSKIINVKKIRISATSTTAIVIDTTVIKRSTLDTGGTSNNETAVPLDSLNIAATASVKSYSVSPTAGTSLGAIRARHTAAGTQANTAIVSEALFSFSGYYDQPIVLRSANQNVCVNVGALGAGGNWAIDTEWTEQ